MEVNVRDVRNNFLLVQWFGGQGRTLFQVCVHFSVCVC